MIDIGDLLLAERPVQDLIVTVVIRHYDALGTVVLERMLASELTPLREAPGRLTGLAAPFNPLAEELAKAALTHDVPAIRTGVVHE